MATAGKLFSPELLSEIRDHFIGVDGDQFSGPRIAFDSAAGALKLKTLPPLLAQEHSIMGQLCHDSDPGTVRIKKILEKGRADVRTFLNAKDGVLYPEFAAAECLFRITMAAVEYFPGTNVVTTDLEHPSIYDPLKRAAAKFGKEFRTAPINRFSGRVDVESILSLIDENTSVLAIIHASNTTGAITDVATLMKESRKINKEMAIIIDGVQYAPHAPIDVDAWKPDVYAFSPYKVTCARGIGLAYVSDRMVAKLPKNFNNFDNQADTNWQLGSRSHAMYAALSNMVDYLCWLGTNFTDSSDRREQLASGMAAVKENMLALADLTVNGVNGAPGLAQIPGVTVYGMGEMKERTAVIIFSIDRYSAFDLLGMYARRGIHLRVRNLDPWSITPLLGMGIDKPVLRVSMCHYASPEEVEKFVRVTEEFASSKEEYVPSAAAKSGVDENPAG